MGGREKVLLYKVKDKMRNSMEFCQEFYFLENQRMIF